jgi:hypothetical protein
MHERVRHARSIRHKSRRQVECARAMSQGTEGVAACEVSGCAQWACASATKPGTDEQESEGGRRHGVDGLRREAGHGSGQYTTANPLHPPTWDTVGPRGRSA